MSEPEVRAIREAAAVIRRPDLYTIKLTGPDRARFLNGMLSRDVDRLQSGEGLVAVKANSRGKVEGVVRVRSMDDAFFVDAREGAAQLVAGSLVQHLVMDDCQIADETDHRVVLSLFGPSSRAVLAAISLDVPEQLQAYTSRSSPKGVVVRDDWLGVEGYELHVPTAAVDQVLRQLTEAGAVVASAEAVDSVRVEAGVPLDGRDIDDETIPQEARLDPALDFDKGCYLGQEVIAKVTNFGGVKHILVGFDVEGADLPAEDSKVVLAQNEKATGEVTSVVRSFTLGRVIALGYVRKAHDAVGTKVYILADGDRRFSATVAALPFVP